MAVITFPPSETTQGPPGCTGDAVLFAETTLTASFVATDSALTKGMDLVVVKLKYTKGSETTARVLIKGSSDGGATWYTLAYADTASSGSRELTLADFKLTPANFDTVDYIALPPCVVAGHALVRAEVKYSGGSAPGSLGVKASGLARPRA